MSNFKLKDIMSYKIVNTKLDKLFGYPTNTTIKLSIRDKEAYKNEGLFEELEEELNILMETGKLEISYNVKQGDMCYFWNGKDKMKATTDNKPFIAEYDYIQEDDKHSPKECNFVFNHCEKYN